MDILTDNIDTVYDRVEEFGRSIAKQYDKMIYDAFELFGYSREWININGRKHVHALRTPGDKTAFMIDGVELFSIVTTINENSDEFTIEYKLSVEIPKNDQLGKCISFEVDNKYLNEEMLEALLYRPNTGEE